MSEIAGPLLAGVLVAGFGAGWALAVDAATFAISAAFLALKVAPRAERAATSFLADLREGLGHVPLVHVVWTFVVWAAVANMVWARGASSGR